jgi:hypothetical protein
MADPQNKSSVQRAARKYRDVHAIDRPDLRKTFKSFSQMQRWFTEHAAVAKGRKPAG